MFSIEYAKLLNSSHTFQRVHINESQPTFQTFWNLASHWVSWVKNKLKKKWNASIYPFCEQWSVDTLFWIGAHHSLLSRCRCFRFYCLMKPVLFLFFYCTRSRNSWDSYEKLQSRWDGRIAAILPPDPRTAQDDGDPRGHSWHHQGFRYRNPQMTPILLTQSRIKHQNPFYAKVIMEHK